MEANITMCLKRPLNFSENIITNRTHLLDSVNDSYVYCPTNIYSRFSCIPACGSWVSEMIRLSHTSEEIQQTYKSKEIDKILHKEKHVFRRQVKLLLLGAGESGKSTFVKQMRIIHGVNFESDLIREYRLVIYQNVVKGMKVLIDAREKMNISWSNLERQIDAKTIKNTNCHTIQNYNFIQIAPFIRNLWYEPSIRRTYDRRREFQISESVSYFFDEIDRLSKIDYYPSNRDILLCRTATKGVYELTIKIQNIPFVFVDVGGQRTQRQKWIKCFDSSVTSVIFLVSTSEFDQVLAEDRETSRLEEAKNIYDTIVNNNAFKGIPIILFLNKSDLLERKVLNSETSICNYYPRFKGNPKSIIDVKNFILELFLSVSKCNHPVIYHHFTIAIDTKNIQVVFSSIKDSILQRNLNSLMLQ